MLARRAPGKSRYRRCEVTLHFSEYAVSRDLAFTKSDNSLVFTDNVQWGAPTDEQQMPQVFPGETTVSWDLLAQDLPASITSLSDIPDDFVPQPIGRRASLIAEILGVVPQADFAEPDWGKIRIPDCEIEIGMGSNEDVECIAFHVYGGELAPGVVVDILRALQLRALDSATGEIFNEAEAADSFMKSQKYRDKIRLDTRSAPE